MGGFEFFDFNICLGMPRIPMYHFEQDASVVEAQLARLNITGGLVRHTLGEESHPSQANRHLTRALDGVERFRPVWAVMPHWTGEFPAPARVVAEMKSAGAPAAVIYPETHGFSISSFATGALLEALEEAGIVLMAPQSQVSLEAITKIARAHPALHVVLMEVGYRKARDLYPLFEQCANVRIETSTYMLHNGIEEICHFFGAERLLFGSRCPLYNPGAAVAGVTYAGIGDEEKRLIAGKNAVGLLEGVRR